MPTFHAIFVEPESPGNIGFIARLVENFGIDGLFLVNPQCEIDGTARERAVHAQETLSAARVVDELHYALEDVDYLIGTTGVTTSNENLVRNSTAPRKMLESVPEDACVGLLFGREGTGLTNGELERCDFVVSIPATEQYPVMNLSHAAAVMFYECFRSSDRDDTEDSRNPGDGTASTRNQRDVLENLFKDVTGTLPWEQHRQEKTLRALRNVLGRSYVTGRETSLLLGLFRDIHDALRHSETDGHTGTDGNKAATYKTQTKHTQ